MTEASLYIHIPFCQHKCIYCDFYSIITTENKNNFLSAVKNEIDYYSLLYSNKKKIISVFFGGGTPSLMSPNFLEEIINQLYKKFSFVDKPEITLETNPGTVDYEKLKAFKSIGANRISVGIQSFNEEDLKFLTRIHDKQTAINTVYNTIDSGFDNISVDLIFNLPNQTKEKWLNNLQTAVDLPIKHISAYSLIVERGTILNKMVLDDKVKIKAEDFDAELYETTIDFLKVNKFNQYEVSNFAKDGFECIHNNSYWHYKDYIGFGPSAHSFVDGIRWWNFTSLKFYINSVNKNGNGFCGSEILTEKQKINEYVMLALRSNGLNLTELANLFGSGWKRRNQKLVNELIKNGFITKSDFVITLTKKGYAVCDEITRKLV
jgi:oxygen-independent coproporphyrinogen-3 oxidase